MVHDPKKVSQSKKVKIFHTKSPQATSLFGYDHNSEWRKYIQKESSLKISQIKPEVRPYKAFLPYLVK